MQPNWQCLSLLKPQLLRNLVALELRYPELAVQLRNFASRDAWYITADDRVVRLGRLVGDQVVEVANPVPASSAKSIVSQLFPKGACSDAVMVAGLDQGWLWRALFEMPSNDVSSPGYQPPLYFLCRDLERLWVVLHFQDLRTMLASARTRLYVGEHVLDLARNDMLREHTFPWPKLCVTVDPSIWPAGQTIDTLYQSLHQQIQIPLKRVRSELEQAYASFDPQGFAQRVSTGGTLRILGITSRYATFLQHSMRDWLSGLEELGHETRLVIEDSDHEKSNALSVANQINDFRPDMMVAIDHFRAEITGLPQQLPFVMWVQDRLPNIFAPAAGTAQTRLDYVMGYGLRDCVTNCAYPMSRFLPAAIGFNDKRFSVGSTTDDEIAAHRCDVSFVSHSSQTPLQLVEQEAARSGKAQLRALLMDIHDRLDAIYSGGSFVTELGHLRRLVDESLSARGMTDLGSSILSFTQQRLNNAFFRHQTLQWCADMGVDLRLYGKGWEKHPTLRPFARGEACNQTDLCAIYRASKINLQVVPYSAAHPRVFDGLAAGAFFLMRYCTGDDVDRLYRKIWDYCLEQSIRDAQSFFDSPPPQIRAILDQFAALTGEDPCMQQESFWVSLLEIARLDFTRSPATLWADYPTVVFATRDQLQDRVVHFLNSPEERREISARMFERVRDTMTYRALSRRMLNFIASDLLTGPQVVDRVAA
jgi:hypothetical protein